MQEPHVPASSTGLDPKVAGLLCYLGIFVTGIIFLVIEKNSRFVKFHAMQSIILFGGLFILTTIFNMIPFIGWLVNVLLVPLTFIAWILMMLMALRGSWFKVPYVGDIAEQQAGRY